MAIEEVYSGAYTAFLLNDKDDISDKINITPPFNPSQSYLTFCGALCGTKVGHFVTTPNTTQLDVTIANEAASPEARREAFVATARMIASTLELIDQGEDIVFRDYPKSATPGEQ